MSISSSRWRNPFRGLFHILNLIVLPSPLPVDSGTSCTDLTYRCKNKKCISKVNPECDGTPDCEDGSDEENCGMSNKTSVGVSTFVSDYKLVIISIRNFTLHDKTDVSIHPLRAAQHAATSPPYDLLFTVQTVGGVCSRRHVLWAVRMQKKESFPGRSASMSKVLVTCVERPSSVRAGWSLLPTVCKMTAGQGSILLYACFMLCSHWQLEVFSFLHNVANQGSYSRLSE